MTKRVLGEDTLKAGLAAIDNSVSSVSLELTITYRYCLICVEVLRNPVALTGITCL